MCLMETKILVVDDEEDIRTSIKTLLEKEGHVISEAANGKQAFEAVKKEKSREGKSYQVNWLFK